MASKLNTLARNTIVDAHRTNFDGGQLVIYSGTEPATADDAITGTALVTITLPTPAFNAAANGQSTMSGTWSGTASATGTATHYRLMDSAGNYVAQGPVIQGTSPVAAGDLALDNTSIASGQTVTINSFTLDAPASI